jgi:hypothetical protein
MFAAKGNCPGGAYALRLKLKNCFDLACDQNA